MTFPVFPCLETCPLMSGVFNLLSSRANYIFHIILRAAVIADYRIIMNMLNIIHHRGMGGSPGDVGEGTDG